MSKQPWTEDELAYLRTLPGHECPRWFSTLDAERAKLADALVEAQASAAIAKGRAIRLADAEAKLAEVTAERDETREALRALVEAVEAHEAQGTRLQYSAMWEAIAAARALLGRLGEKK